MFGFIVLCLIIFMPIYWIRNIIRYNRREIKGKFTVDDMTSAETSQFPSLVKNIIRHLPLLFK
jgi:hypothetical protein